MFNSNCYNIKELKFTEGQFDEIIDCTYVILCCDTKPLRERSVMKQIRQLRPSSRVRLIYNKGFKKCSKNLIAQSSEYDLRDALMYVFNDTCNEGFDRIMVLEDDFEIDERIKDKQHKNNVMSFIKKRNPDVYGLGNFCIINPLYILNRNQHTLLMGGSHAVIYNSNYCYNMIERYKHNVKSLKRHCDMMWNFSGHSIYRYHIPLIYQKHVETENSKNWYFTNIIDYGYFMKHLKLDVNARKGYDNINIINYLLTLLMCLIIFQIFLNVSK